jgi:hypothetical protein
MYVGNQVAPRLHHQPAVLLELIPNTFFIDKSYTWFTGKMSSDLPKLTWEKWLAFIPTIAVTLGGLGSMVVGLNHFQLNSM